MTQPRPLTPVAASVRQLLPCALASLFSTLAVAQSAPAVPAAPAADEPVRLSTFEVTTTADRGYRAGNSVSATRIDTPIKDLPFSISAFTDQFINDIGALELIDIATFAPGVTSGAKEFTQGNNRFSIRGFDGDVTPQRNGFVGNRYVDAGNVQRVEVVKGPSSLLYGQITPGGTVNYITKRPQQKEFTRLKLQAGTDSFWRAEIDSNQPLADGRVGTRFVAAYENLMAWANPSGGYGWLLAGAVDVKVNDRISIIVDVESNTKNQAPLIGMKPNMQVAGINAATAANYPVLADRARAQAYVDVGNLNLGFLNYPPLPKDFNYVGDSDYRLSWFDSASAEVNVKLSDNWRARANAAWQDFKVSNKLTGLAEFTITPAAAYIATAGRNRFTYRDELAADPVGVMRDPNKTAAAILTRRKRLELSSGDTKSYQAELAGLIELGGVKVRPLFGAFLSQLNSGAFRRESSGANPPVGLANSATAPGQHFQPWDYNNPSTWVRSDDYDVNTIPNINNFTRGKGEESAVYGLLNTSFFDDRLIVIGGARYNKSTNVNTNLLPTVTGGAAVVSPEFEATKTTPQIGAGFKLRRDVLLFASYSESFFIEERQLTSFNPAYNPALPSGPANSVTITTDAKPTTGSGYEFGVKTDLLEGRVSSTISWFHLEREDRVLRFRETAPDGTFPTITRQGTVDQSEGLEVEVTWSPNDHWQVFATFTAMDIKTIKGSFPAIYTYSTDPAVQAAYVAAYNEARDLILNAVPEGSAETLASLWSRYNFQGDRLKGLWLGAGFIHTGKKAQRTANPTLFLAADTIYDATLGYDWKSGRQEWGATLAWKNIADTEYFNANQSRGQPGRVILSVTTKF